MAINPGDVSNFKLLSGMQGNIIKGHGREHTTHIFIHFDKNKTVKAKAWIKAFAASTLTSAQKQLKEREVFKRNGVPGGLFSSFYLSAAGYAQLGIAPPAGDSFRKGMKHPDTQQKLKDPLVKDWEKGYREEIHAMVLLAHDHADQMAVAARELMDELDRFSRIVHVEYGNAIRNADGDGLEHFGYVDGISQPLFLQDEVDAFKAGKPLPLQWDPEAELSLVLVQDVAGNPAAQGSYFVFRKLEQHVKAFKNAEKKLAKALGLPDKASERAGAMLVGRYEDGTPLTMNEEDGIIASGAENNFNYSNDTSGAKCPFHAHIRKTNPRGSGGHEPLSVEKGHMMARRGIPYGCRNVSTAMEPSVQQMPEGGVGLLFMSYQADLANQFEFIQELWVNNPKFPPAHSGSDSGSDPIIGQGIISNGAFAVAYDNPASLKRADFGSFVTLKGGEYFFAPSIPFLTSLP